MAKATIALMSLALLSVSVSTNAGITDSLTQYVNLALATFRDAMKNGLPEFGIAPLEPVKLHNMSFNSSGGGVSIKHANFTNVTLYGLSTMQISKLEVTGSSKLSMNLELKFDNWTIHSDYNMSGKAMDVLPFRGHGKMEMELANVVIDVKATFTANPNGTYTIKPGDMALDIHTSKISMHFHGLLGGGPLSGLGNKLANFFSERIFDNAKPKLIQKMTHTLQFSINHKLESIKI